MERKVNSRERKNQQRRGSVNARKSRGKKKGRKEGRSFGREERRKRVERGWFVRNIVRDSKVDERVGSHVDVKDRNCEFVDPRVE